MISDNHSPSSGDQGRPHLHAFLLYGAFLFFFFQVESGVFIGISALGNLFAQSRLVFLESLGLFLLSTGSILIWFCLKSRFWRVTGILWFFAMLGVFLSFKSINSYGFDLNEALLVLLHPFDQFTGDAITTFLPGCFGEISLALAITLVLATLCGRSSLSFSGKFLLVPALSALLMFSFFRQTNAQATGFPFPLKIPILVAYAWSKSLFSGIRRPPSFKPTRPALAKHLIVIVDESIRGDFLGINNSAEQTTPFLRSIASELLNFGIACSATNRSSDSNIVLQTGMMSDSIPDYQQNGLMNSNIFQFARAAGFKTYFVTGQNLGNPTQKFQNFMTPHDLETLDKIYSVQFLNPGIKQYEIDPKIFEYLETILSSNEPTFTFVVKMGAHFHYENSYPQDHKVFQPTLEGTHGQFVFQPNLLFGNATFSRELVVNSYRNAVRWSVDDFFRKLFPLAQEKEAVIVYTSDHGQNLLDDGTTITHAQMYNPAKVQANVPLFILADPASRRTLLEENPAYGKNVDRISHFQVFPTILYLMGYSRQNILPAYGQTLFDEPPDVRFFFSGDVFGRSKPIKNLFDR